MRLPDGHHQQDSLFLCELVYLASPTTIRKRANRTQAYFFHLWQASLGLCKTRQQTKAWMTASTSNRAINLVRRQSRNTLSPLICSTEKVRKNIAKHATQCQTMSEKRIWRLAGRYATGGTGVPYQDTREKKTFSSEILFCLKVFTAVIRPS